MGALATALQRVTSLLPERKTSIGAQIPTWEQGKVQSPKYIHNYWRFALDA